MRKTLLGATAAVTTCTAVALAVLAFAPGTASADSGLCGSKGNLRCQDAIICGSSNGVTVCGFVPQYTTVYYT